MRLANENDLPRIVVIYNSTIPSRMATADTKEVTLESRVDWFLKHSDTRPIFVEEIDGNIVSWVSFESFYGRPAYHLTAEISIYVDAQHRGQGIGSKLLDESIKLCPSLGLKNLVAYIFSHNKDSLALFEKQGFTKWGELPEVAEMDGKLYSLLILGLRLDSTKV
ncbi:GNAT family N-acetyltransferase [Thermodesulfobacteriota bacterium]